MQDQQRYDTAVQRLATYGYEVLAEPPDYLVSLHRRMAHNASIAASRFAVTRAIVC